MSTQVAYRSTDESVLTAWREYQSYVDELREGRNALSDSYGRRLMVNKSGFGHGTRVTGFETLDGEKPGDETPDGALRIPLRGSTHVMGPNLRRKAGKDLAAKMNKLTIEGPRFPGMPGWTFVGFRALAPALFSHADAVWVLWSDAIEGGAGGEVDHDLWESVALSTFYAAREQHDAAEGVTA